MPTAELNGINTHYEVIGSGPPLLMFAPGGFNATIDNWRSFSVYGRFRPLDHLAKRYTCIVFDQREAGSSGGRVERITWDRYASHGRALLDHLGVEDAHVMGGCMGCSPVVRFAVTSPERVRSMVLFWPAGGPNYRIRGQSRFMQHIGYVHEQGLSGVASLARSHDKPFTQDPRIGPWGPVLRRDDAFAETYQMLDAGWYELVVIGMARTLFDRDTVPGAEPEDLLRLEIPSFVIPGDDSSHTRSAARYLQECLHSAEYWDVPVSEQTNQAIPEQLLRFLDSVSS